jgi:predicted DsbA family dithiol-disulfide isomerase
MGALKKVDLVSDVICPWCFIGLVRLEEALAKTGASDVELTLHPFQLDPSTPPEGADLRERLAKKFGVTPANVFQRVEAAARESGIPLDFEKVRRSPNTLKAHTLLGAAKAKGSATQRALARAIFEAYFLEGRDVGEADVLADTAAAHGFDRDAVLALLADPSAIAATRHEAAELAGQGISGVPFTIFDGKLAVSGAQSVETFASVVDRARSDAES